MPLLDVGSASYYAIAWTLLTLPWLTGLLAYNLSPHKALRNAILAIAFLAYLVVNVYLLRHAHHLNDFPFMGIKWWPIWLFLSFKLALAIFYTILIKAKSHPFAFLIICGSINLISVFNFEGVIVFLSLE